MPIKVRCQDCRTVMGVPEKYAGKAIKCKACGAKVQVPAGGAQPKAAPKKKKKKRPAPAAPPADAPSFDNFLDDDMFGGLDLGEAEHEETRVCPKCAKVVDEEEVECPYCGVDLETGGLSETQRKRRERKGPPPEEFYGTVWSDGWQFVGNHKGFALRTGLSWGFCLAMVSVGAFVLNWYIPGRAQELRDSANNLVQFQSDGSVLIAPKEGQVVEYDGVRYGTGSTRLINGQLRLPAPQIAAALSPPTFFWAFIMLIFFLACTGWAWALAAEIVQLTMAGQKKIKRFQGDIYKNMMKGFTTIFWPLVLMVWVSWIPGVMVAAGGGQQTAQFLALGIYLIPFLLFLPIAVVHMSQPYTYRAWLLNWVGKDFLNTFAPNAFVSALFFGMVFLLPAGIVTGAAVGWNQLSSFYASSIEAPVVESVWGPVDPLSSWQFALMRVPLLFFVTCLTYTVVGTIVAFPAVFIMRVFGLFGLYFRPDLSLCVEQPPLSDAGFGPRFLAYQIDYVIMLLIGLACALVGLLAGKLFGFIYGSAAVGQSIQAGGTAILTLIAVTLYFARWESGSGRASLGKWSLGMIVVQYNNEPMDMKLAVKRTMLAGVSQILAGIPFAICAFTENHRAMHDSATKTKVVWRGDEEM